MQKRILVLSLALAAPCMVQAAGAQSAADIYKGKCAMCHGADGSGNTPAGKAMKARNFHDAELVKAADADIAQAITKGKNKMPAYGNQFSQEQIQGLVAYIRGLQQSGK